MDNNTSAVRMSGRRAKRKTFEDFIEISDWKAKPRRRKSADDMDSAIKSAIKSELLEDNVANNTTANVQPICESEDNKHKTNMHDLQDTAESFAMSVENVALNVKQEVFNVDAFSECTTSSASPSQNSKPKTFPKKRGRKPKSDQKLKRPLQKVILPRSANRGRLCNPKIPREVRTGKNFCNVKYLGYQKKEAQSTSKHFCRKTGCGKTGLACCIQATESCMEVTGKTSRWHHMSVEEHYCNACFEYFYRGTHSGCEDFHEWRRAWMQNSKIDSCFKNLTTYMSERQLPYWLQCTLCGCWRSVTNEVELAIDVVRSYTCIMGNLANTLDGSDSAGNEYRRSPHVKYICDEPNDPCIERTTDPEIAWIPMLSYSPFLKHSPAALFLTNYYPDGVGMSAVDTTCSEVIEDTSSKSENDNVLRPSGIFDRINIDRSTTTELHCANPNDDSSAQTSMLMSPGGRKHISKDLETPDAVEGLSPYFQPFYTPHERGKALCMRPDVMELDEAEEFPEFYKEQTLYLAIRNFVIALWTLNPKHLLTTKRCCEHLITRGLTRVRLCELVVPRVISFATRKGLINFGVLGLPPDLPSTAEAAPRGTLPDIYSKQKVIVVGAGPAGLAAARQLHNFGCEVICVEARDRIGGRVHDDWSLDGVCVGRGAQIINGCVNNPLALISHQLGLNMHVLRPRCDLYDGGDSERAVSKRRSKKTFNKPVSAECDKRMDFHFNALLDIIVEWRQAQEIDAQDCSLGEKILEAHQEWIVQSGLSFSKLEERILNFHIGNLEFACGASLDKVSAFHWDQNEIFAQFNGDHAFVQYGFGTQLEALASGLDVRYNLPVTKINYGKSEVRVHAGKNQIFTADRVLVAIPLAVLRSGSIQFQPALPTEKIEAMQRLGCGCIEKIALQFPYRFWDEKIDGANYFGYVPTAPEMKGFCTVFYDVPYPQCEKSNVLMSVISGDSVELARTLSEEKIKNMALTILADVFPEQVIPQPVNFFVTRWRDDPYAQMAYSYVHTGSSGDDYDELAKDVNEKLFFAGEGTNRHFPQTVTGAYLSGLREAAKIAAAQAATQQRT